MFLIKTVNSSFLLKNKIKKSQTKFSLENLSNIKRFKKIRSWNILQLGNNVTNVLENSINYILNIHFSNTNTFEGMEKMNLLDFLQKHKNVEMKSFTRLAIEYFR